MFSLYRIEIQVDDDNKQQAFTVAPAGAQGIGTEVTTGFATRADAWDYHDVEIHNEPPSDLNHLLG